MKLNFGNALQEETKKRAEKEKWWDTHSRDTARIVDGSRDEELALAINDEGTAIIGDIGSETQGKEEREQ